MPLYANFDGGARRNKLLAALPEEEWARLGRDLQPVSLKPGQVMSESGAPSREVYLPTTAVISLLYLTVDGSSTEVAAVGSEGLVGISAFMGGGMMPGRAVVQHGGGAYCLSDEALLKEFRRGGVFQRMLLLYALASHALVAQTAVCNQHHSVDQRLARWLLLSFDRFDSNQMSITHELIGRSLGVRREGVTEATGKMQRRGMITVGRGRLTMIDRRRLEAGCCECYRAIRGEYDRLFRRHSRQPVANPFIPLNGMDRSRREVRMSC